MESVEENRRKGKGKDIYTFQKLGRWKTIEKGVTLDAQPLDLFGSGG